MVKLLADRVASRCGAKDRGQGGHPPGRGGRVSGRGHEAQREHHQSVKNVAQLFSSLLVVFRARGFLFVSKKTVFLFIVAFPLGGSKSFACVMDACYLSAAFLFDR